MRMGSLGKGNAWPEEPESFNLGDHEDTQLLDSQPPSSPLSTDENGELLLESTMLHCGFDTQIVDRYDETQVLDFDTEIQVTDSHEDRMDILETQLLDEFATQVFLDNESEGKCQTEELVTENDSTDDESVGPIGTGTVEEDNKQFGSHSNKGELPEEARNFQNVMRVTGSGSPRRGFTSIRTASLRASGLAARSASTNKSDRSSSDLLGSREFSEETALKMDGISQATVSSNYLKEINQEQAAGRLNDEAKGQREKNQCRVGSSTVRRLFTEDVNLGMDNNSYDKGEETNLTGLSYIDSQEPGDLSQANALDFVDRFLKENLDDLHQGTRNKDKTTGVGNPASAPSIRGPQLLAAKRATVREAGFFDWDDAMEDEGGGDLFCRKKNYFFNGKSMPKSHTQPRKEVRSSRLEEQSLNETVGLQENRRGLVRSAPTLKINERGERRKKRRTDVSCPKRNLTDVLVAEASGEFLKEVPEEICTVGFDTQLAAEAMEALCRDEGFIVDEREDKESLNHVEDDNQGVEQHSKCPRLLRKRDGSNAEAKKKAAISHRKSSRNIKRLRQTTKLNLREKTLEPTDTHELDISCGTHEMKKCRSEDKLLEVSKVGDSFTPIACRIRSKEIPRIEKPQKYTQAETNGEGAFGALNSRQVPPKSSATLQGIGEPVPRRKRSRDQRTSSNLGAKRKTLPTKWNVGVEDITAQRSAEDLSITGRNPSSFVRIIGTEPKVDESPRDISKVCNSVCITPTSYLTPSNNASPVCVGNEYFKNSCNKISRTNRWKEVKNLIASSVPEPSPASRDTRRKWRDMANVRVLFSHHLDDDIVKQQKKIMARLGALGATSISDATHFVTDNFVRTRNMLEAIASSKPVVTHLWLESCGEAGCFLDERNYILRDTKKEKEFGFSMPNSLSRAHGHPLLLDMRVFVTASTKPSKEIISSLVKTVGGQPTERLGRSALKDNKLPDDLLIISCEEDYDICLPFLERGASVYSSELLLNGIVIQKLEYERHQLFVDSVKRTRSTTWLKNRQKLIPVPAKCKAK